MVPQYLYGGIWAAHVIGGIGKLNGHQGGLRILSSCQPYAAAKEPYLRDHVAEVGAGV